MTLSFSCKRNATREPREPKESCLDKKKAKERRRKKVGHFEKRSADKSFYKKQDVSTH